MPNNAYSVGKFTSLAGFGIFLIGLYLLGYHTSRPDFTHVLLWISICFLAYLIILRNLGSWPLRYWLLAAVVLRLVLLGATPELSDDFYRFIWDGKLWLSGIHPFSILPSDLMMQSEFNSNPVYQYLYRGLNSPHYFTIYPPISQLAFVSGALIFPEDVQGSIVVMRLFIITAEIGTLWFLPKVLSQFQLKKDLAALYAFNPLVIVELTGNLHFEAVMIFFVVLALYFFPRKLNLSAIFLGLAVSTKLVPLIFLPLLWGRLPLKQLLGYYLICGLVILVCFIPLFHPSFVQGMSSSLGLYFQKFEFNASIYYLVREVGFFLKGYNIIGTAGKALAFISFMSIITLALLSYRKMHWGAAKMWSLLIYLSLTTTVHPWYVTTLVLLSSFTSYRFAVLWSLLVFLSYAGYQFAEYQENLYLVALQYLGVALLLLLELRGFRVNLLANNGVYQAS